MQLLLLLCLFQVFFVQSGDTRVGLVGFPSVGKSTLLTKLTGTASEAAAYEFTVCYTVMLAACLPALMCFVLLLRL